MSNELDTQESASLDLLIAELRRKADAATPGPWSVEVNEYNYDKCLSVPELKSVSEGCVGSTTFWIDGDATFIAAARTMVPALLDALEAMRAQRDTFIWAMQTVKHDYSHSLTKLDAEIARVLKGKP